MKINECRQRIDMSVSLTWKGTYLGNCEGSVGNSTPAWFGLPFLFGKYNVKRKRFVLLSSTPPVELFICCHNIHQMAIERNVAHEVYQPEVPLENQFVISLKKGT